MAIAGPWSIELARNLKLSWMEYILQICYSNLSTSQKQVLIHVYIYTHTYAFSSIHFMSSNIGYIKANTKVVIWTYLLGPLWMGGIFCDNTERNNKLLHVPTSRAYGIAWGPIKLEVRLVAVPLHGDSEVWVCNTY